MINGDICEISMDPVLGVEDKNSWPWLVLGVLNLDLGVEDTNSGT